MQSIPIAIASEDSDLVGELVWALGVLQAGGCVGEHDVEAAAAATKGRHFLREAQLPDGSWVMKRSHWTDVHHSTLVALWGLGQHTYC